MNEHFLNDKYIECTDGSGEELSLSVSELIDYLKGLPEDTSIAVEYEGGEYGYDEYLIRFVTATARARKGEI